MASQDLRNKLLGQTAYLNDMGPSSILLGTIIDTKEFESLTHILMVLNLTAGVLTLSFEDGDDPSLSDASAVPDKFVIGSDSDKILTGPTGVFPTPLILGYVGHKRYVRARLDSNGSVPLVTEVNGVYILSHAHDNPV